MRTYCNKKCQTIDWKIGRHKQYCGASEHPHSASHQPWCAYLDRDPEIDCDCLVETNMFKANPRELITTGMNTCMFVVVKTKSEILGWHASIESLATRRAAIREKFGAVTEEDFVSAFLVPGEDREESSLLLKPTCRTMRRLPWTDPSNSRDLILDFLKEFEWFKDLETTPPVGSYKDFVVFDMAHRRPYTFSNPSLFDSGCTFDGNADAPRGLNLSLF